MNQKPILHCIGYTPLCRLRTLSQFGLPEDDDDESRPPAAPFPLSVELFAEPSPPPAPPAPPRFLPASDLFFRGFFFKEVATNSSRARSVEGFKVSKSISISSGLESRRAGSRSWMIWNQNKQSVIVRRYLFQRGHC